ncbi:Mu transposase C-terminal domain-containing protein [Pseudoalteromonas ruthenica]|uniref:Mu transposase C-terminal domain-containing protein n=1 Tax=Pseudoalteromonas ruthenica TaxID=151081 RepID=UPI00034C3F97|nr:DDE-type integrase/transposase/recombinase [Pseudoalteromonas ruthenica]
MKTLTALQIAAYLLVSKRSILKQAKEENWAYEEVRGRGGKIREYIIENLPAHVSVQLMEAIIRENQSSAFESGTAYSAMKKKLEQLDKAEIVRNKQENLKGLIAAQDIPPKAQAKYELLKAALCFIEENGQPKVAGFDLFSELYNQGLIESCLPLKSLVPSVSRITLIRWQKAVDTRGVAALAVKVKRSGKSIIESDQELKDFCVAMVCDYPHVKATHIREGLLSRFSETNKGIPAETTIRDWLTKWKKENASLYTKLTNPDAWKNKFMSAMGKMDESVTKINQLWEFDSTPADVMLTDGRHSLIGIIDVYTRRPAVVVHPTSNSEGICLVIRKAILDWGIPDVARTDNGADYTSIQIESVFDALEIEHQTTRPFSGEEKPYIERFFRTFSHGIAELLTGYIGHNVAERQNIEARKTFAERLAKRAAPGKKNEPVKVNLTSEQLQQFIDDWIANLYMHRPHGNLGGKTPHEILAASRDQIRVINDERLLDVMLQPVPSNQGRRTVGKEGIKVSGGIYIAPELGAVIGDEVLCKWDPKNAGRIYVFNRLNKEFVCIAVDPEIESAGLTRQEIAELAKRNQKAVTAEKIKQAKRIAKSINVSNIANEVLEHHKRQNQAITAMPKRRVEHKSSMMDSALLALEAERPALGEERLNEIDKKRAELQREAEAAAINPAPIFKNTNDKAMYLKQQRLERDLTGKEKGWLSIWEQQNRAMSSRLDSLIEERDMASTSQHRQSLK